MPSYAAFIGHQPHISVAELSAAVPGFTLIQLLGKNAVVFESSAELDQAFLDRLGGTVVLAKEAVPARKSVEEIPHAVLDEVSNLKGKVTFSLRTHGLAPSAVQQLYRKSKDLLKKHGKPSRYVGNEHKAAISIVLHESDMIGGKGGREICVLQAEDFFWVGVTVGAQDIEAYSKRDMQKPVRDTTVGLLPPKLAQVLINFGVWLAAGHQPSAISKETMEEGKETKKKSSLALRPSHFIVLDPFCGTGVIPMECLLRGYAVLASDKSQKAVDGCEKNLDWLRRQHHILKGDVPGKIWKQDATKPFELEAKPDIIVTETTLGPALTDRPSLKEVQKHKSENESLQEGFLKSVAQSLPGTPIACTWPVWYYSRGPVQLERVWKTVEKLGYEAVLPEGVRPSGEHKSLLYRRPDQFVGREIVLLKPKRKD